MKKKTSAVHFLRFQFDIEYINGLRNSSNVFMGCSHSEYECSIMIKKDISNNILEDLD